jgi:hypothetical protein
MAEESRELPTNARPSSQPAQPGKLGECNDGNNLGPYLNRQAAKHENVLRTLGVLGQVFLKEQKAKDGDTLKLRIESKAKGAGGGNPALDLSG